jgi:hypothetical protein
MGQRGERVNEARGGVHVWREEARHRVRSSSTGQVCAAMARAHWLALGRRTGQMYAPNESHGLRQGMYGIDARSQARGEELRRSVGSMG